MHGGASGSGAQKGNKNAVKTGSYSRAMILLRKRVNDHLRATAAILDQLDDGSD
jgi:uncharacterized protein YjcR